MLLVLQHKLKGRNALRLLSSRSRGSEEKRGAKIIQHKAAYTKLREELRKKQSSSHIYDFSYLENIHHFYKLKPEEARQTMKMFLKDLAEPAVLSNLEKIMKSVHQRRDLLDSLTAGLWMDTPHSQPEDLKLLVRGLT